MKLFIISLKERWISLMGSANDKYLYLSPSLSNYKQLPSNASFLSAYSSSSVSKRDLTLQVFDLSLCDVLFQT